jgi:FtsP/CotA-like multicopper oxidase with cupredoxin domain
MKLIGGDGGRVEHEELIDGVVLGPSERAVADVLIEQPGELTLEHHTPSRTYRLASLQVGDGSATPSPAAREFPRLRTSPELQAERQQLDRWLVAPPDKTLAMIAQLEDPTAMPHSAGPVLHACPMHPEITSEEPGRCPKCGMKLLAVEPAEPAHHPTGHDAHAGHREHSTGDGIEWEDDMVEINRLTTTANTHWRFVDRADGVDSPVIDWRFSVGQRVKIRLVNEMDSDHPMHHPFHLHGAGRFLVLSRDGTVESNLMWKDTVLIPTGQTVDIMFDVSNPGLWMAHCHIPEHMQSGMMFSFSVAR